MFVKSLLKAQLLPSLCSQTAQLNSCPSTRSVHSLPASFTRKNQWNRAVSEAEKLVGYPTSLVSVRALMDDDFANIAVHMRKLIGSDHPVLQTVKRLVYQGKNKMQVLLYLGYFPLFMTTLLYFPGEGPHHAPVVPGSRTKWIKGF